MLWNALNKNRLEAKEQEKKVIRIRGEDRNKRKLKKIWDVRRLGMIPVGNDIVAAFG